MFHPARCPYRPCPAHRTPSARFCRRHGSYAAACRPQRVPRFRCKACGRTFSRQTFRMDYRDHRPSLNGRLLRLLISGVGLRQSARMLGLSRTCTDLKARKIARHLRRLNLNLQGPLPEGSSLQFDEFETYEGRRNTRPLTLPMLIETRSRFIVWAESAPIPASGRMSAARLAAIAEDERRFGRRRPNHSPASVRRTFARGARMAAGLRSVLLTSDEKSTYPALARRAFGRGRLVHERTKSDLARMTWNPLFPINHTEAMARDLMGRLRRRSWLVSKRRRYLDIALHVFIAYRNLVRPRFNRELASPAQILGLLPRRLQLGELLSWRQDGGPLSVHPLSRDGRRPALAA